MGRCSIKIVTVGANTLLLLGLLCMPSHAATETDDTWHFQVAPYAWLSGQHGTVATQPGLPAADVDLDFYDDIADNINGAFFIIGEARKGRYGVVTDIAYTDIEIDDSTPGPLFSGITSRTKTWVVSAAGFYRLVEHNRAFLDATAGFRYWSVDASLKFNSGLLPGRKSSNTEDWVDPVIGLKGLVPLGSSRFFVSSTVAVGGFGVGSDYMLDGLVNLGYQWTETLSAIVGYRYLKVDYEEDDFLYDVYQDGIVLGLSWRF